MNATDIERMTPAERVEAMEQLWEALCRQPEEPASPAWHRQVLEHRGKTVREGRGNFLSVEEARERLRRR